ncbi:MAG: hypothetical protein KF908_10515 [Nitrosomonas sp.]|jgi:hypothetical protein|uniref:Uncharacterized protein n=1 Tax=Nitrosomonas aestuarii TaxID=52441 RepID=A0A1I4DI15_9PROT|nr:hypothetical protein [Nitrosomonas aestuarii]MBX3630316.1 hypothetical protein [Nitrosomonas sp.]SFK93258.1 hypothetical protein SAMN05216302_102167 [Nitrosomonas aestuarii]
MKTTLLVFLSAFLLPVYAAEYNSIRPLLMEAIAAPTGHAAGTITGQFAENFKRMSGSGMPVFANVTTVHVFEEEGCRRLNLHLKQSGVITTEGKPADFDISYGINLCRDGNPPAGIM